MPRPAGAPRPTPASRPSSTSTSPLTSRPSTSAAATPSLIRCSLEVVRQVGQYQSSTSFAKGLVSYGFGLYHRVVAAIRLDQVTKAFGAVTAVDDVSLEITDGE